MAGIFSSTAAAMGIISRAYCRQAHSWLTLLSCCDITEHIHTSMQDWEVWMEGQELVFTEAWVCVWHLCEWKHNGHPGCNVGRNRARVPLLSAQSDIVPAATGGISGRIEALMWSHPLSTACIKDTSVQAW